MWPLLVYRVSTGYQEALKAYPTSARVLRIITTRLPETVVCSVERVNRHERRGRIEDGEQKPLLTVINVPLENHVEDSEGAKSPRDSGDGEGLRACARTYESRGWREKPRRRAPPLHRTMIRSAGRTAGRDNPTQEQPPTLLTGTSIQGKNRCNGGIVGASEVAQPLDGGDGFVRRRTANDDPILSSFPNSLIKSVRSVVGRIGNGRRVAVDALNETPQPECGLVRLRIYPTKRGWASWLQRCLRCPQRTAEWRWGRTLHYGFLSSWKELVASTATAGSHTHAGAITQWMRGEGGY